MIKEKDNDIVNSQLWQWGEKGSPIAYDQEQLLIENQNDCAYISVHTTKIVHKSYNCQVPPYVSGYVCMKRSPFRPAVRNNTPVHFTRPSRQITRFPTKTCADGSLVQTFHPCHQERRQRMASSSNNFPLFSCRYGASVHYTLVCDGNTDCPDGSDETLCKDIILNHEFSSMFRCKNFQLVPHFQRCDGKYDCFDETDEKDCLSCSENHVMCYMTECLPIAYCNNADSLYKDCCDQSTANISCVVWMDGFGKSCLLPPGKRGTEGTFQCTNRKYYIPSFLLNNGELDCTSGEDEDILLENLICPGFYRCQYISSCVHPNQVCDDIHHCPYKDDERYCDIVCPTGCLCEGYAFSCTQFFDFSDILQARYLDISGSVNVSLHTIRLLQLLTFLNLSHCDLDTVYLKNVPQLRSLDVSFNDVKNMSSFMFEGLSGLRYLDVSGNPFVQVLDNSFSTFIQQSSLNYLSRLMIRQSALHAIKNRAFTSLNQLEALDIRNSFINSYEKEVFAGLDSLQQLYTDDSKLCCPYFHNSRAVDCMTAFDDISSCSDLLRSNFFRVFLWLIAILAILGNVGVMLYRLLVAKQNTFSAFRVLVTNLCVADLIMGIYMTVIGIADILFQGVYMVKDKAWKKSTVCKVTGFLGFMSSEASALTVCLITLDRVLVLCFPLQSHFHLAARSSLAACGLVWSVAVTLAAVPLLTDLEFYGVSDMCLSLPITRREFSGQFYSFGVFIIFNFVLFLLIGLGQMLICLAIHSTGRAAGTSRRPQEMTIARRLLLVIFSDFCCWFPIGLMGLLAQSGVPISDEMNVWTAIFVLPLNSALNPFLYTLNTILEKRRAENVKKESNNILRNIKTKLNDMLPSTAEEIMRIFIRSNIVKRQKILEMLKLRTDTTIKESASEINSNSVSSADPENMA